jgi:hypothetical protein
MIIIVGFGWLLSAAGYAPGINWIWTSALAAVGVATFVLSGGLDKFSIVLGPFFLVASLMSVARQAGWLSAELETPKLVILLGVLLLLARWKAIPLPSWFDPTPAGPKSASESSGKTRST